jgi:hypothetical protein
MKELKQILPLGFISIALHVVVHLTLASISSYEFGQENEHVFIMATMFVLLLFIYFFVRYRNNKVRPSYFKTLAIMFFVQIITVFSLTSIKINSSFLSPGSKEHHPIALHIDPSDLSGKTLIFAIGLPSIVLTILYVMDKKPSKN